MLKGSSLSLLPPPNLRRKHKAQKKFNSKTRYKCAAAALISKDFAVAFGQQMGATATLCDPSKVCGSWLRETREFAINSVSSAVFGGHRDSIRDAPYGLFDHSGP
ncbi:hypothetical protein CcaCcLH18_06385 [Colletotrichum camelliae]|nr:hypothetical protein CcaCcLH18_06385 [Colletotrichum camelliae]